MLVSSSDGCCRDGLVAAILFRAAAMIAVCPLGEGEWMSGRGGERKVIERGEAFFDDGLCAGEGALACGCPKLNLAYLFWEWCVFGLLGFMIVLDFVYDKTTPGLFTRKSSPVACWIHLLLFRQRHLSTRYMIT